MRKGFTLVELSIVLVIIGLLTGGILVASSMINTAKINRLISDLRSYETAASNFKLNYRFYPGDTPYLIPPGRGNNDLTYGGTSGVSACASAPNALLSNFEYDQAWYHLSQTNMIKTSYVAYSPTGCGGPHDGNFTIAAQTVLLAPMTEMDGVGADMMGYRKVPIRAQQNLAGYNFYFLFYVPTTDVLALESKLGAQSWVNFQQVGLVNAIGLRNCYDAALLAVLCSDPTAKVGSFYYLLPSI